MPKAVKDHRSKKNPQSYEAWGKRKQQANADNEAKVLAQYNWRGRCLTQRQSEDRLTDRNQKEVADRIFKHEASS